MNRETIKRNRRTISRAEKEVYGLWAMEIGSDNDHYYYEQDDNRNSRLWGYEQVFEYIDDEEVNFGSDEERDQEVEEDLGSDKEGDNEVDMMKKMENKLRLDDRDFIEYINSIMDNDLTEEEAENEHKNTADNKRIETTNQKKKRKKKERRETGKGCDARIESKAGRGVMLEKNLK